MIRPIRNDASCSSASCHAHPALQKVLGVIDVHLSLAAVDRQTASLQRWQLAGSLRHHRPLGVSVLFVYRVLHRPMEELMAGIHRVTGGDLTHRVDANSHDELGELAESFNKMTAELADAQVEITAMDANPGRSGTT